MFDFDKVHANVECPLCKFPNSVSIREMRFGLTILCRGCKANIRFVPNDGGAKKVKRALDDFKQAMNQTFKLTIKF